MGCARSCCLSLCWKFPELKIFEVVPLFLGKEAGDCSQAPILVGFAELRGRNTVMLKFQAQLYKRSLISDRGMNIGRMMIDRPTMSIAVLHCGMGCLNALMRGRNVATRDGVQICLAGDLGVHDALTGR